LKRKHRRAGKRQGKQKGDLVVLDDHDDEPDETHVVQEGDPFGRPVQIHRMIEGREEAFDVPPLRGGSGCTDEQDGLLLTAVGPCPSFGDVNWGAVGQFADTMAMSAHGAGSFSATDDMEPEQLYLEHRARDYADASHAPEAADATHIWERRIDDGGFAGAAPPREQTDAARRRSRRLARRPNPQRQPPGRAVRSQRWTEEDALHRAVAIEFEGRTNPWSTSQTRSPVGAQGPQSPCGCFSEPCRLPPDRPGPCRRRHTLSAVPASSGGLSAAIIVIGFDALPQMSA
jgi:hypothetical protein